MERIILSAIRTGGDHVAVAMHPVSRHNYIIHHLVKCGFETPIKGEQGFLTSNGRFVDRVMAADIAKRAGQIVELEYPPNLYSEDVFGDGERTYPSRENSAQGESHGSV